MGTDLIYIFQWWFVFLIVGIIFFPLSFRIFSIFVDRGYIFSKILGFSFIAFAVYALSFFHIVPFSFLGSLAVVLFFFLVSCFFIYREVEIKKPFRLRRVFLDTYHTYFSKRVRVILLEEIFFLVALLLWAYIRGHQPAIHGLEKFMDFGFVNSILRTDYFPPQDMWFTPYSINYYYFGHLATAVLTQISRVPSYVSYNLMISTLFAFSFTGAFSLGVNLMRAFRFSASVVSGILAGLLVSFSGSLHIIYAFFQPYDTESPVPFWELVFQPFAFPNSYWYPNATRFIMNTIHEFPIYSFVVSDLHGHVLAIPFVLITIALILVIFLRKKFSFLYIALLSFFVALLYMTNAMDGVIYFTLSFLVLFFVSLRKLDVQHSKKMRSYFIIDTTISRISGWTRAISFFFTSAFFLILGFFLFSYPFQSHFEPFVSAIGVLCAPQFLIEKGTFGPLIFEADHCQRSPWWQLLILYGFFLFFVASLFVFYARVKSYTLQRRDYFVILIAFFSFVLLLIPEFVYAKDIYPAHYRANTMFKLAYQAFIMLSIVSAFSITTILSYKKRFFIIPALVLVSAVVFYSWIAINSFYHDLQNYRGLDGVAYMEEEMGSDYHGVMWLRKNVAGQPVLLEAQGDSYTDYARISANTGLPTVLGWTVHEWLWRGSYDVPAPRIEEVRTIYEASEYSSVAHFIEKYDIQFIYVGGLEREQYPGLNENKFISGGFEVVFEFGDTRIYQKR